MAGDWIKVEKSTARKREVLVIAGTLGIHPDHAFGLCFRFWSWCDDNLTDGHALSVTKTILDQLLGHDGFAEAAINAGWLRDRNGSLEVPHFDRHLSQSAKTRALAEERKRKQRSRKNDQYPVEVTKMSRSKRDKSVTREEKRREESTEDTDVSSRQATSPDPNPEPEPKNKNTAAHQEIVDAWNELEGLPKVERLTPNRKTGLKSRLSDPYWRQHWRQALTQIPASDFLSGRKTKWRATFDWFIRPESVVKIIEGQYNDANAARQTVYSDSDKY